VPPELLEYVENGRNPDIYTREFVELVRRGNQLMRGKMHAFASFRDVLAQNMATAMPELKDDVDRVLEATGGAKVGTAVLTNTSMTTTTAAGEQRNGTGTSENGASATGAAGDHPSVPS
jgi:mediator of RNA polymerase II transcription subunit 10